MANSDYRLQLSVALLGLEQTHLAKQSYETGRHLLLHTAEPASASGYLRDVLSRLHECSKTARKYRYRLAAVLVQTAGSGPGAMPLLQAAAKQAIACIKFESQAADVEELAALVNAVAAAVAELPASKTVDADISHLGSMVLNPLMLGTARAPSQETAATGHMLLSAALQALNDAPGAATYRTPSLLPALEQQLHNLNSGSSRMEVPQAFLPVQQCLRGLSAMDLQATAVKGCVKACLRGARHKEWAMRRQSLETLADLAKALQPAEAGHGPEDPTAIAGQLPPGTQSLLDVMPKLLADLQKGRYDKIQHVRASADKALRALQTLAACCHRSDIAAMPTLEATADSGRPTSATRRALTTALCKQTPRPPLTAVSNTPASSSSATTPSKRRSLALRSAIASELDFGVQVFAKPLPSPELAAQPSQSSGIAEPPASPAQRNAPADKPAAADMPPVLRSSVIPLAAEQQDPADALPSKSDQLAAAADTAPAAAATHAAGTAAAEADLAAPELNEANAAAEAPSVDATRPAIAPQPAQVPVASAPAEQAAAQLSSAADVDTAAGPLRVQMNALPAAAQITLEPHVGVARLQSLQSLRIWVGGAAASAELGIEIIAASPTRQGVSTVHRFVCRDGLMCREVVDCLAVPPAAGASAAEPPAAPAASCTAPL